MRLVRHARLVIPAEPNNGSVPPDNNRPRVASVGANNPSPTNQCDQAGCGLVGHACCNKVFVHNSVRVLHGIAQIEGVQVLVLHVGRQLVCAELAGLISSMAVVDTKKHQGHLKVVVLAVLKCDLNVWINIGL